MMNNVRVLLFASLALLSSGLAAGPIANVACPNAQILGRGLIDRVCWSCMFPMRLLGIDIFNMNGGRAPPDRASQALCLCGGDLSKGQLPVLGFTMGFWQPLRLIEVVRRPYCFPALGGMVAAQTLSTAGGGAQVGILSSSEPGISTEEMDFWNFHYYAFPLIAILELLDSHTCNIDGMASFDLLQLGEAYPNWYSDELSFLIQPESLLFTNPFAVGAGTIECAWIAARDEPIDSWFWTAGCWGSVYPFSGNMNVSSQIVNNWSLASTKFLYMLARLTMVNRTTGNDALCKPQPMPILKKSQYRLQMMFPVPETEDIDAGGGSAAEGPTQETSGQVRPSQPNRLNFRMRKRCCHSIGDSTLLWGDWRHIPATGEDGVFLLWQWVDCCLGVIF